MHSFHFLSVPLIVLCSFEVELLGLLVITCARHCRGCWRQLPAGWVTCSKVKGGVGGGLVEGERCPYAGPREARRECCQVWRLEGPRSSCQQIQYLARAVFLARRQPPSCCVFTQSFLAVCSQEKRFLACFSSKGANPITGVPSPDLLWT